MAKVLVDRYENGVWVVCNFEDLKAGDIFRAYSDPVTKIISRSGDDVFIAVSNVVGSKDKIEAVYDTRETETEGYNYVILMKGYKMPKDENKHEDDNE